MERCTDIKMTKILNIDILPLFHLTSALESAGYIKTGSKVTPKWKMYFRPSSEDADPHYTWLIYPSASLASLLSAGLMSGAGRGGYAAGQKGWLLKPCFHSQVCSGPSVGPWGASSASDWVCSILLKAQQPQTDGETLTTSVKTFIHIPLTHQVSGSLSRLCEEKFYCTYKQSEKPEVGLNLK